MKATLLLAASGLTLLPSDSLRYDPAEGSSVTRSATLSWELALEDLSVIAMGQELDASMIGNPEIFLEFRTAVLVTDEFIEVDGGRLIKLARTFDELEAEMVMEVSSDMGDEEVPEMEYESALVGRTVLFTWDAESEEYSASWGDGEDGDSDLLEGLVADMDFKDLLPDGEVTRGDSWDFKAEALSGFGMPGGNTALLPKDMDVGVDIEMFEELMGDFEDQLYSAFDDLLEGTLRASHAGPAEDRGEGVLAISLELETDGSFDFSEMIDELMQSLLESEGIDPSEVDIAITEAAIELEFEAGGELYWDTAANRSSAANLAGDMILGVSFAAEGEVEGEGGDIELFIEFGGDVTSVYEVRDA